MRPRLRHLAAGIAAAGILALGGCGDGDGTDLASLVPPDVPLYAEVVLRPEGDQRDAIESLSQRVAGIDDPGGLLIDQLNQALAGEPGDFTYEDDIEPWLGDRGAVFVLSFEGDAAEPDFGAMVEVSDTEAAQEFIDDSIDADPEGVGDQESYEGVDYLPISDGTAAYGLIGDALVFGTIDSFKVAVDASQGESLAESEEYTQRSEPLGDDALATAYFEPAAAIEAAISAGDVDPQAARMADPLLGSALSDPVTVGVAAQDNGARIDVVGTAASDHPAVVDATLIEALPAGSWLAVAASDLGPSLDGWIDQLTHSGIPGAAMLERRIRAETGLDLRRDVTPWLGDAAGFIQGTEIPGMAFGLIAEVSDPEGPRKLIESAQALAEADSGLRAEGPPPGADYGFSLGLNGFSVGVAEERLVAALATSFEAVLHPNETLGDDPGFQAAADDLGADFSPSLYLGIPEGLVLAERGADTDSPDYDAARPYIEKLDALIAGARVEDGLLVARLIVTLAQ